MRLQIVYHYQGTGQAGALKCALEGEKGVKVAGFIERDSTEAILVSQWSQILGETPSDLDADFFYAGGDSLTAVELAVRVGKSFGREIPLDVIFEKPTIRGISDWLKGENEYQPKRIIQFREFESGTPFILFPGAGGTLAGLGGMSSRTFRRPTYIIQSKGLLAGESPFTSMDHIVDDAVSAIEETFSLGPIHLGGFCVGGIVAYAVTDRLLSKGWHPYGTVIVNSALNMPHRSVEQYAQERLHGLSERAGLTFPSNLVISVERVYEHLISADIDIAERSKAAFRKRLEVFASNLHAISAYRPPALDIPVTLLSTEDRNANDDLSSMTDAGTYPDWTDLGIPNLRIINITSPHEQIFQNKDAITKIEESLQAHESMSQAEPRDEMTR
ncbi:phosphopantetheine-binding protein [Streptomyces sp. DSM 41987]|uniref:thioesterase domain-containing protein n=1 Tax=Streptomyces TaxID=1883 RepID=UPI0036207095